MESLVEEEPQNLIESQQLNEDKTSEKSDPEPEKEPEDEMLQIDQNTDSESDLPLFQQKKYLLKLQE